MFKRLFCCHKIAPVVLSPLKEVLIVKRIDLYRRILGKFKVGVFEHNFLSVVSFNIKTSKRGVFLRLIKKIIRAIDNQSIKSIL